VLVIIESESRSLGVLGLAEAMTEARKRGLDLVEVNPAANPPVCKVLDYGKYLYNLSKKEKDTKKNATASKLKELTFHMNIAEHDYEMKMRHAEEFMWKGMKVKLQVKFRGREMMHQDIGMNLVRRMRKDLEHIGTADAEPKLIGKSINLMLSPLPARKRVRKFSVDNNEAAEDGEAQEATPETSRQEAAPALNGNT
jgi:translation initiation factor IF-3